MIVGAQTSPVFTLDWIIKKFGVLSKQLYHIKVKIRNNFLSAHIMNADSYNMDLGLKIANFQKIFKMH